MRRLGCALLIVTLLAVLVYAVYWLAKIGEWIEDVDPYG